MTHDIFDPWLSAEKDGRDEAAEEALFELFATLPMPTPSQNFVDSVLSRSGIVAPPAPPVIDLQGWWRWGIAASFVCAAVAVGWLMPLIVVLATQAGPGAWIASLADLVPFSARLLADGLAAGRTFAAVVDAVWHVATTPQALFILTAMATTIFVAGRRLSMLIGPRRSFPHVPFA